MAPSDNDNAGDASGTGGTTRRPRSRKPATGGASGASSAGTAEPAGPKRRSARPVRDATVVREAEPPRPVDGARVFFDVDATVEEPGPNLIEQIAETAGSLLPAVRSAPATAEEGRMEDVDHWGRSERMRALTRQLYDPVYKYWFRAELQGLEHVPEEGGALLVSNHAAALPSDAPVIMHGIEKELGRPVYGLAEHLFRTVPVVGTLWARGGGVSAHPENAHRLLHDERQLVLVFPEGAKGPGKTWSQRYQLRRFGRGGFVETAMRAGVPVIPIAVVGAEESMPIVANLPWLAKLTGLPYAPVTAQMLLGPPFLLAYFPAKFTVRFLPPVHFSDKPNMPRYSRARVMENADLIRDQIQQELWKMLRERKSVWFG